MSRSPLTWFAADRTFEDRDGWYVGAPNSFRIGPYPSRDQAEERSRDLLDRLARCDSSGDRVRVVRAFLLEQNERHGCQLRTGAASPSEAGAPADHAQPPVRQGEQPRLWFRTSRFFSVDDVWFFSTRENIDVGPYESREEAERDAVRLIEILRETTSEAETRLAIQQFKSRPRLVPMRR